MLIPVISLLLLLPVALARGKNEKDDHAVKMESKEKAAWNNYENPGHSYANHTCSIIKNPFLQNLVLNGVYLYNNKKSLIIEGKCEQEWEIHGTCCDYESLVVYLKKNLKEISSFSDSFITDAGLMLKLVESGITNIIKTTSSIDDDAPSHPSVRPKTNPKSHRMMSQVDKPKTERHAIDEKKSHTDPQHPKHKLLSEKIKDNIPASGKSALLYQLNGMMNKSKIILSQTQNIRSIQSRCLAELEVVREAAICSMCSGRSQVFFKDNSTIQIGLNDCQNVIEQCHDYWTYLVDILDEMLAVEAVLKSAGKSAEDALKGEDLFKSSEHHQLIEWIQNNNLREYLKECKQRSTCSAVSASDICSAFITIQKPDKLARSAKDNLKTQINEAMQLGQVNAGSLIKKKDLVDQQSKGQKSNFEPQHQSKKLRLLQSEGGLTPSGSFAPTLEIAGPVSFAKEVTVQNWNLAPNIDSSTSGSEVISMNPPPSFI